MEYLPCSKKHRTNRSSRYGKFRVSLRGTEFDPIADDVALKNSMVSIGISEPHHVYFGFVPLLFSAVLIYIRLRLDWESCLVYTSRSAISLHLHVPFHPLPRSICFLFHHSLHASFLHLSDNEACHSSIDSRNCPLLIWL